MKPINPWGVLWSRRRVDPSTIDHEQAQEWTARCQPPILVGGHDGGFQYADVDSIAAMVTPASKRFRSLVAP